MSDEDRVTLQAGIDAALAQHRGGELAEAERRYRQLIVAAPQHPVAWHLLGAVLQEQGRSSEAIEFIERAIQLHPIDAVYYANLGEVYRVAGRLPDAERTLRHALAMLPDRAETHYKLGLTLSDLGQSDEALECFEQAIRLNPRHAAAHSNAGCELSQQGRAADALPYFIEALRLEPGFAVAMNNLGAALSILERADEALPYYQRALQLNPAFREAHSNWVFALNYQPSITPDALYAAHVDFGARHLSHFSAPALLPVERDSISHGSVDRDSIELRRDGRLRIGYLSGDWRRHPVAYFLEPILQNHDRSRCEIFCYHDYPHDDEQTARLQTLVEHWIPTVRQSDAAVLQRIRADDLDVLVDLSGHTTRNRLGVFAQRAAPVQISYLGYVNTTGVSAIDYRLTDAWCDPLDEPRRYTEQLVRLPRLFCAYAPLDFAPEVNALPAIERGYVTFGSLHNLSKLSPPTLELWSHVLHAVPRSRLKIVRRTLTPLLEQRFAAIFASHGIERDRLEFVVDWDPAGSHLACYQEIDVTLDVLNWSGHTTACESLWQGVPVVTMHGNRYAGRMVSSVLHALERPEWIATSAAEYIAAAVRLTSDLAQLAQVRAGLRDEVARSPLCDGATFTRELEGVYYELHARYVGKSNHSHRR